VFTSSKVIQEIPSYEYDHQIVRNVGDDIAARGWFYNGDEPIVDNIFWITQPDPISRSFSMFQSRFKPFLTTTSSLSIIKPFTISTSDLESSIRAMHDLQRVADDSMTVIKDRTRGDTLLPLINELFSDILARLDNRESGWIPPGDVLRAFAVVYIANFKDWEEKMWVGETRSEVPDTVKMAWCVPIVGGTMDLDWETTLSVATCIMYYSKMSKTRSFVDVFFKPLGLSQETVVAKDLREPISPKLDLGSPFDIFTEVYFRKIFSHHLEIPTSTLLEQSVESTVRMYFETARAVKSGHISNILSNLKSATGSEGLFAVDDVYKLIHICPYDKLDDLLRILINRASTHMSAYLSFILYLKSFDLAERLTLPREYITISYRLAIWIPRIKNTPIYRTKWPQPKLIDMPRIKNASVRKITQNVAKFVAPDFLLVSKFLQSLMIDTEVIDTDMMDTEAMYPDGTYTDETENKMKHNNVSILTMKGVHYDTIVYVECNLINDIDNCVKALLKTERLIWLVYDES